MVYWYITKRLGDSTCKITGGKIITISNTIKVKYINYFIKYLKDINGYT